MRFGRVEPPRQARHSALRLFHRYFRPQPTDDNRVTPDVCAIVRFERDRRPQIGARRKRQSLRHPATARDFKAHGHHAYHPIRFAIQRQRPLSPVSRILRMRLGAEVTALEVLTDDDDAMPAVTLFFRQKVAPRGRLCAEQREQVCGYEHTLNPLRSVAAGEVEILVMKSRELRERLLLIPPGQKITYSHVKLAAGLRVAFPDHHQSFRVRIWKRFEQYRANNTENRRVRADAERECGARQQGEAGIPHQHSRSIAKVLPQILDPSHTASVAASFLSLLHSFETS